MYLHFQINYDSLQLKPINYKLFQNALNSFYMTNFPPYTFFEMFIRNKKNNSKQRLGVAALQTSLSIMLGSGHTTTLLVNCLFNQYFKSKLVMQK